jgi:membrane associated rhomboid family serine protease
MSNFDPQRDRASMGHIGPVPIFASTLLVAALVVTMVLTTIAISAGALGLLDAVSLSSADVLRGGRVWQMVTYIFVNGPTFWFAWSMLILFYCGRELEQYFGRRAFLGMYAAMVLATAASVLLFAAVSPAAMSGCWLPNFAVFAAFAFVHPRMVFCWIPVIWIAAVCFVMYALQFIAGRDWSDLFALCVVTGAAWAWTKWQRGHFQFKFPAREKTVKPKRMAPEMDALLDKISKDGLHSLTAKEREQLEKARQDLLRK